MIQTTNQNSNADADWACPAGYKQYHHRLLAKVWRRPRLNRPSLVPSPCPIQSRRLSPKDTLSHEIAGIIHPKILCPENVDIHLAANPGISSTIA